MQLTFSGLNHILYPLVCTNFCGLLDLFHNFVENFPCPFSNIDIFSFTFRGTLGTRTTWENVNKCVNTLLSLSLSLPPLSFFSSFYFFLKFFDGNMFLTKKINLVLSFSSIVLLRIDEGPTS